MTQSHDSRADGPAVSSSFLRKVVIHQAGSYERLTFEEAPDLVPGPREIVIDVRAIGINYADVLVRMGLYASAKEKVGWPITPGFEVAGLVQAAGAEVEGLKMGDRVFAIANPVEMTNDSRSVLAFNLFYLYDREDILELALGDLMGWLEEGAITAPPVTSYPLDEVARAHADIESGLTTGKLVLVP